MALVLPPAQPKESFSSRLGANLGAGISQGIQSSLDFANRVRMMKKHHEIEQGNRDEIKDSLIASGVDPVDADLYVKLNTGGQTHFVKELLEKNKRKPKTDSFLAQLNQNQNEEEALQHEDNELEDIILSQDEGLTPSERVSRGKERFAVGQKVRSEALSKLRTFARDKERLGILEKLSSGGKLPEDLGRLNVNKDTGDLILPFAASAESQRFIKTLNEFSSGAKDTFGSRITNFDLSQYLKRFPTLLNSKEGRRQILQQMNIVNDINSVYYKNLNEIYRKAGGARRIDPDVAEDLAERKSEKVTQKLAEKFDKIGQFTSLPNASEFSGKTIRNPDTGEVLRSDGETWRPVE